MAEAQLTSLLNSLSGSLGNFVFKNTPHGILLTNKPQTKGNPRSEQQRFNASILSKVSASWKQLSDSERDLWEKLAKHHNDQKIGKHMTGQTIHNRINWYREARQLSLLSIPPQQSVTSAQPLIYSAAIQSSNNSRTLSFTVNHNLTPTDLITNHYTMIIEITKPLPSPARKPRTNDYRLIKGISPESFVPLLPDGSNYSITNIRFPLQEDAPFGLRLSVLQNSIPSNNLYTGKFNQIVHNTQQISLNP